MADPKALARKFVDKFGPIFRHTNDETIREIAPFLGEIVRLAVQGDSGWWRNDIPRPHKRADGIPTRSDVRWYTLAELAISRAMRAVEEAGGSPKLTEAVTLLSQARDCVADHVEGTPADALAPTDAAPSPDLAAQIESAIEDIDHDRYFRARRVLSDLLAHITTARTEAAVPDEVRRLAEELLGLTSLSEGNIAGGVVPFDAVKAICARALLGKAGA